MNIWLIFTIFISVLCTTFAKLYLTEVSKKHGPLYPALRLLIFEEKLNANLIWNETQHQIDEISNILHKALYYMHNNETIIKKKLNKIHNLENSDQVRKCYKQYEREIARFNRQLIQQYYNCKEALNNSLSHLKSEIVNEIKYIHDSPAKMQQVMHVCNVTDLWKRIRSETNYATITICVLTNLAEINQNVLQATQVILRIMARMSDNASEDLRSIAVVNVSKEDQKKTVNVCLDFQDLKEEFETIYDSILWCIKEYE